MLYCFVVTAPPTDLRPRASDDSVNRVEASPRSILAGADHWASLIGRDESEIVGGHERRMAIELARSIAEGEASGWDPVEVRG